MPIYVYRCTNCGHTKDVLQRISDPLLTVCPSCGQSTMQKQVTAAGFQLKGSGWYVTDFRGDSKAGEKHDGEAAKGEAAKGEAAKGEGPTASGSESDASGNTKADAGSAPPATPAPAAKTDAAKGDAAPPKQP